MPVTLDSTVARHPDPLAAEVDGETVLMSVERGNYYGLAQTGQDIWSRIAQPVRVTDLVAALSADYDAPRPVIEAETLVFLSRLADEGLIRVQ